MVLGFMPAAGSEIQGLQRSFWGWTIRHGRISGWYMSVHGGFDHQQWAINDQLKDLPVHRKQWPAPSYRTSSIQGVS